jgi:hypothetical protein
MGRVSPGPAAAKKHVGTTSNGRHPCPKPEDKEKNATEGVTLSQREKAIRRIRALEGVKGPPSFASLGPGRPPSWLRLAQRERVGSDAPIRMRPLMADAGGRQSKVQGREMPCWSTCRDSLAVAGWRRLNVCVMVVVVGDGQRYSFGGVGCRPPRAMVRPCLA